MLIFPTGHGKNLLFQLLPFIEAEYTTVLFVPLQLLKFQFGEAAQYPIATWRSNHTPLNSFQFTIVYCPSYLSLRPASP